MSNVVNLDAWSQHLYIDRYLIALLHCLSVRFTGYVASYINSIQCYGVTFIVRHLFTTGHVGMGAYIYLHTSDACWCTCVCLCMSVLCLYVRTYVLGMSACTHYVCIRVPICISMCVSIHVSSVCMYVSI